MKKLMIVAFALTSLTGFAGETERDMVKLQDSSAQGVYAKALDLVEEIKGAKRQAKLPYLNKCNWSRSEAQDTHFFRRNAWTSSHTVRLNHVTGVYSTIVNVSCNK